MMSFALSFSLSPTHTHSNTYSHSEHVVFWTNRPGGGETTPQKKRVAGAQRLDGAHATHLCGRVWGLREGAGGVEVRRVRRCGIYS